MRIPSSSLFLFLMSLGSISIASQIQPDTLYFEKFGPDWPKAVKETSGLMFYDGLLWTHNDSGNKPFLYALKPGKNKISKRWRVKNAANVDWEDLALAPQGFYIGDIGDNRGRRDYREILFFEFPAKRRACKLPAPVHTKFTITGEMFLDPPGNLHNRDMEAMAWVKDKLLIFTKNRKDHLSYILALDKFPADTVLAPVGVLQAGGLVTGADYKEDQDMLALVGYARFRSFLYVVPGFLASEMESDRGKRIILQGLDGSQVEGVTWIGEDSLLISTEKTGVINQSGFIIKVNHLALNQQMDTQMMLFTPVFARYAQWNGDGIVNTMLHARRPIQATIEVITFDGVVLDKKSISLSHGDSLITFNGLTRPSRGAVFVRITAGDEVWSTLIQDIQ